MSNTKHEHFEMAHFLSEALPYMQRYDNKTVVVKYGGHAMGDPLLAKQFARDIVLLKQSGVNPVVVHGGGPQIAEMLKKLNIKSEFKGGLRVTTEETIEIVEMVLAGNINKQIVASINEAGGCAVGVCGKDGNMIVAKKLAKTEIDPDSNIEKVLDLGFVGEVEQVNTGILDTFLESNIIPVIAPIGTSLDGHTYNI
ncbi:MAG: acetylglutamate kinase, partial [Rhizobiales bacterium]|nr:acetylglutamate kinase [Hyphomicrobiales bacterium]